MWWQNVSRVQQTVSPRLIKIVVVTTTLHGHPVCSQLFRHRVLWVGQQTGQEQTTADHQDRGTTQWCQPASLHPGLVHPETGENEQVASLRTPHISDTIRFGFSPQGGATHLWTLHQLDMRTVSSHRPPLCSTLYQTVSQSTYTYKYKKMFKPSTDLSNYLYFVCLFIYFL